jgi:hypothetical protein
MPRHTHTLGGQVVGREPLHCETVGASDYCHHCGRLVTDLSPCPELERLRLENIPDEDVAAFGCSIEAADPTDEEGPCKKWCHRSDCAYTLKQPESRVTSPAASIHTG